MNNTTNIYGNLYVSSLSTSKKTILLNSDASIPGSSGNSGFTIADVDNTGHLNQNAGYFVTTNNPSSYKMKAPNSSNVISFDMANLTVPAGLTNPILVLAQSDIPDSNYKVMAGQFDLNNIFMKDNQLSTATNQIITTDVGIQGNVFIKEKVTITNNGNILQW